MGTRLQVLASWTQAVTILLGTLVAYYEYTEHTRELREERTLRYVERFWNDPLYNFQKIYARVLLDQEYLAILKNTEGSPVDRVWSESGVFVDNMIRNDLDFRTAAIAIINFFDDLSLCVDEGLCDDKIAAVFLGPHMAVAYNNLGPYISLHRTQIKVGHFGRFVAMLKSISLNYPDNIPILFFRSKLDELATTA